MGRYRATWELCDLAVVLITLGRIEELRVAVGAAKGTRWAEALQHYVTGEFDRAAEVFAEMEVPRDEADARLRAAEKLLSDGCPTEADEQLQRALTFYRSVGATRYVREAEGCSRRLPLTISPKGSSGIDDSDPPTFTCVPESRCEEYETVGYPGRVPLQSATVASALRRRRPQIGVEHGLRPGSLGR